MTGSFVKVTLKRMVASKVLCLLLAIYIFSVAHALTDEDVKKEFIKTVMKCNVENPIEMAELLKLQALKVPTKKKSKCLLACAYKKIKTFDEKGLYDLEQGYKIAELSKEGDEKRLKNGRKLAEICSKVNDMEVTDGDKGCDRAAFFFQCILDNAPKLGFKV